MANAEILIGSTEDIPVLVRLYNEIFRPPRDEQFFRRRFLGRRNILLLLANIERVLVGFTVGFELKPSVFFSWLCGVSPDARRQGVAAQLLDAQQAWATEHSYRFIRMECFNGHRPVMQLAISQGYDVVGIRYDHDHDENLIIFEKLITEEAPAEPDTGG